jgi:hypothetical protein
MSASEASSLATIPESLKRALRDVLTKELTSTGASDIDIHPGADHDGASIIVVEVKHSLVDKPIDVKEVIAAERAARDLAWETGERRFVLVDHLYDEKQKVAGVR